MSLGKASLGRHSSEDGVGGEAGPTGGKLASNRGEASTPMAPWHICHIVIGRRWRGCGAGDTEVRT